MIPRETVHFQMDSSRSAKTETRVGYRRDQGGRTDVIGVLMCRCRSRRTAKMRVPAARVGRVKSIICMIGVMAVMAVSSTGCARTEPIVTYTIPTNVPEQLRAGKERMLAAIVPKSDQVWFFKSTGPEDAMAVIEREYREFVRTIEFDGGQPVLADLPEGWRIGGDKPMRFATIDIETPKKQLSISVSKLGRQSDWDAQVKMNVNRWRGQLGLDPSDDKWAAGEEMQVAAADGPSVWVDVVGQGGESSASMMPPMMRRGRAEPSVPDSATASQRPSPDPRLKYERPDGWRDGRMSAMRIAAFDVGPEEASAELTLIQAGGDLRGNVARWLGQVRSGNAPDDVVDQALEDAQEVDVDGRQGQRFYLSGDDPEAGTVIDATIIPLGDGISLFVKMTGPAKTVADSSDEITAFLQSLKLNL